MLPVFCWLRVYFYNYCIFKKVQEFQALSKEILSLPAKAYFTMIHLDCEELKQGLAKKAKNYAEKLLEMVITSHQQQTLQLVTVVKYFLKEIVSLTNYSWPIFCDLFFPPFKRICVDFETIRDTALKPLENTNDIIELIDYINYTKTQGIPELKEKIQVTMTPASPALSYTDWLFITSTLCFDRRSTVDSSISVKSTLLRGMKWSLMQKFLYGQRKSSASLSSAMRYSSLTLCNIFYCLFHTDCQAEYTGMQLGSPGIPQGKIAAKGKKRLPTSVFLPGYWDSQGERDGWAASQKRKVKGAAGKGAAQDYRVPVFLWTGHGAAGMALLLLLFVLSLELLVSFKVHRFYFEYCCNLRL